MIIYGSTLSPYVRKALAFADEKGIAVEARSVGLGSKNPDFHAASPFRKMPALRDGDFTLSDSSAIVHYLDALRPEPALIPVAPQARGRTIWFDEFADTILVGAAVKLFFNRVVSPRFLGQPGDLALADKAEAEEMPPILDYLETMLPASGHLVDDRLTLADISVGSVFANLGHAGFVVDAARWPGVAGFAATMLARPSFAALLASDARLLAA